MKLSGANINNVSEFQSVSTIRLVHFVSIPMLIPHTKKHLTLVRYKNMTAGKGWVESTVSVVDELVMMLVMFSNQVWSNAIA